MIKFWKASVDPFFESFGTQSQLFPFICTVSKFYERDDILDFVECLDASLFVSESLTCDSLLMCRSWYFWFSFLMMQLYRPELDFSNLNEHLVSIFAKVIVTAVSRELDFIGPFICLQTLVISHKFDVISFARAVFIKVLDFPLPIAKERSFIQVLPEVFQFLFSISLLEACYQNIEFLAQFRVKIHSTLIASFQSLTFGEFCQPFRDFDHPDCEKLAFSARDSPAGCWLDAALAEKLP
jgi:hypothetical protein